MKIAEKPHLHRDWIHPHALKIVDLLQKRDFQTYLVGGCVRDLMAGIPPKDFDIATSARPNQVKRIISNAYVIGRRFRLVLVKEGSDQFEVATFRRSPTPEELDDESLEGDNLFGTPEQDALRRDFTCNGLFYDPVRDQVIDHCEGLRDIENRVLAMIGNPDERLIEDPIRILRALRLSHKIGFTIEPSLREAMARHAPEIARSVLPRRREEILKILRLDDPSLTLHEAYDLGLLSAVFPTLAGIYGDPEKASEFDVYFLRLKSVFISFENPVELFTMLILPYVRIHIERNPHKPLSANALLEHPRLRAFMRDELGMFNTEQIQIAHAIQMQETLQHTHEFEKRGRRRKNGFLGNESFPLALQIAKADFTLSPSGLHHWSSQFEEFLSADSARSTLST